MNIHRSILVLLLATTMVMPMVETSNIFATSSISDTAMVSNTQSTSGTVSTSPYKITLANFNVGAGSNTLLVVGVSANNADVASVTFAGASLTKAVSSFNNNDAEFWYLTNPSGSGNVVVTMSGSTSVAVGAYAFSGVDQSSPIATTSTNTASTASSPTISITTANQNSLVLELSSIYGGVTLGSPTCAQQLNLNVLNAITSASSLTTALSPGTVTCSWTASNGGDAWDDIAMEIKASGSGTGGGTGGTPPPNCGTQTQIGSNFNGNSIAGGNTIWFNSNMKLKSSVPSDGLTVFFTGQTITGSDFTSSVPDSEVIFSSSATTATTSFNTSTNMW